LHNFSFILTRHSNNLPLIKRDSQTRSAGKWYPDAEFINQFMGAVAFPDEVTSKWKQPNFNGKLLLLLSPQIVT